jgi:hypothetical protein
MTKKIFVISTFPIKNAQHGGQKRLKAIVDSYNANGFHVRHVAVFYKGYYSDYSESDIPLGSRYDPIVSQSPYTSDIVSGEAINLDLVVKKKLTKELLDFDPDIIDIHQPFIYLGLKSILNEIGHHYKLIYNSYNIEAPMKESILKGANLPIKDITICIEKIKNVEMDLTKNSDLSVGCTKQDVAVLKSYGAKTTVLAVNGINPIKTSKKELDYWKKKLVSRNIYRLIMFIGSAHPPNWTGFYNMVGKGLGFIPYDTRICLAGSIGDYFKNDIKDDNRSIYDATFWRRAFTVGRINDEGLGALIKLSDIIILPITEGGGSNLKTAEAILANKKVVTTQYGLRSFEWYNTFPNLWIANDSENFRRSINDALVAPFRQRTDQENHKAASVTWEHSLKELINAVKNL